MAERKNDEMLRREQSKYFANMPDEVVQKEFPRPSYGLDYSLNDNIYGIDENQSEMKRKIEKHMERGY